MLSVTSVRNNRSCCFVWIDDTGFIKSRVLSEPRHYYDGSEYFGKLFISCGELFMIREPNNSKDSRPAKVIRMDDADNIGDVEILTYGMDPLVSRLPNGDEIVAYSHSILHQDTGCFKFVLFRICGRDKTCVRVSSIHEAVWRGDCIHYPFAYLPGSDQIITVPCDYNNFSDWNVATTVPLTINSDTYVQRIFDTVCDRLLILVSIDEGLQYSYHIADYSMSSGDFTVLDGAIDSTTYNARYAAENIVMSMEIGDSGPYTVVRKVYNLADSTTYTVVDEVP